MHLWRARSGLSALELHTAGAAGAAAGSAARRRRVTSTAGATPNLALGCQCTRQAPGHCRRAAPAPPLTCTLYSCCTFGSKPCTYASKLNPAMTQPAAGRRGQGPGRTVASRATRAEPPAPGHAARCSAAGRHGGEAPRAHQRHPALEQHAAPPQAAAKPGSRLTGLRAPEAEGAAGVQRLAAVGRRRCGSVRRGGQAARSSCNVGNGGASPPHAGACVNGAHAGRPKPREAARCLLTGVEVDDAAALAQQAHQRGHALAKELARVGRLGQQLVSGDQGHGLRRQGA